VDPRGLIPLESHEDNPKYGSDRNNHYGSICSRTWRPKQAPSIITEKFTPALVSALSKLTDCIFYIDQDNGEVNVTGATEGLLDRAETKLGNLERDLVRHKH